MKSQIISDLRGDHGFTAVEAFFTIIILGIMLLISLGGYQNYLRRNNVASNMHEVMSYLERARTLSTVSYADVQYGIHFDADQYVLFKGPTYTEGAIDNEERSLSGFNFVDPQVFSDGQGGTTEDVFFTSLSGMTTNTGTIRLESNADSSIFRLLTINDLGSVAVQQ